MRSLPTILAVLWISAQLAAQAGNGGNGELRTTPMVVGHPLTVTVTGGVGMPWQLFSSDAPAELPLGVVGTVWIDVTTPDCRLLAEGITDAAGLGGFTASIPDAPEWRSLVRFGQGLVMDPNHPSGVALTSALRIQFGAPDDTDPLPLLDGPRTQATADLLPDGRVLVAGGGVGDLFQPRGSTTTRLYQPYTRSWSAGPPMIDSRADHASVVLADGRVLVTGGVGANGAVHNSCEIFEARTGLWASAQPMIQWRSGHAASLLPDGRVLVTGGSGYRVTQPLYPRPLYAILVSATDSGEIYDPSTDTWMMVSNSMGTKRIAHAQARLLDGRIVVLGGWNGATLLSGQEIPTFAATTSVYDPASNSFSVGPPLALARAHHRATTMPNGEVFVSGGAIALSVTSNPTQVYGVGTTASAVVLSADGTSWSEAGTLPTPVYGHAQVLLPDGRVHVSGGYASVLIPPGPLQASTTGLAAVRSPGQTTLIPSASFPPRAFHLPCRLRDGTVLFVGGVTTSGDLASNLLYTPDP